MTRYTMTRQSYTARMTRQEVPADAPSGTEVFYSENTNSRGQMTYQATTFTGKRQRPDIHNLYASAERRDKCVANWLEILASHEAAKAEKKAAKAAAVCTFEVGDILTGSWGYDQTNVEIFQITAIKGRKITVQEMTCETVEGSEGFMCDSVVPGTVCGEPITKIAQTYNGKDWYVKLNESCNLYKWSGNKMGRSWYA